MEDALFANAHQQVAALCWRDMPACRILLITSLSTRRWIVPKGWPMEAMSLGESAAREAEEEAGVTGTVSDTPIGEYYYMKARKGGLALPCRVSVFALHVSGQKKGFAEQGTRDMLWLPPQEASSQVSDPGLAHIILNFGKSRSAGGPCV